MWDLARRLEPAADGPRLAVLAERIAVANALTSVELRPGQVLRVPARLTARESACPAFANPYMLWLHSCCSSRGGVDGPGVPVREGRDALPVLPALGLPCDRLPGGRRRAGHPSPPFLRRVRAPVHHGRGGRAGRRQAQRRDRAVQPGQGRQRRPAGLPGSARRRGCAAAAGAPGRGVGPGRRHGRGAQPRSRAGHPRPAARARRGGLPALRERLSLVLLDRGLREGDRRPPPPHAVARRAS